MPILTDSIGRVLGNRYRLVSPLGTGASAHVFLAEDVSLKRRVAVKVLLPTLVRDESFLKRFRAEARSVAALNHPNILSVFDWGEAGDGPYLILEYLQGGTLRDVLDLGYHLTHAQAARLGAEAAKGLAYAHSRGLVHRDIKPANILFDEEGRVRIADFGVARALAEAAWTEPSGAMVGTARYASPEQALGENVDGRADVYALALVVYEALTGVVPFVADTTTATLMARVDATLPFHQSLGPFESVLPWAAASNPQTRLDAASFATRLEAIAAGLPLPGALPRITPRQPVDPLGPSLTPEARDGTVIAPGLGADAPHQIAEGGFSVSGLLPPGFEGEEGLREALHDKDALGRSFGFGTQEIDLSAVIGEQSPMAAGGGDVTQISTGPETNSLTQTQSGAAQTPAHAQTLDPASAIAMGRADLTMPGGTKEPSKSSKRIGHRSKKAALKDAPLPGASPLPKVRERQRARKWPWFVAVLVVVGSLSAAGLVGRVVYISHEKDAVPSVKGSGIAKAKKLAHAAHFKVIETSSKYTLISKAGVIISQSPNPGIVEHYGQPIDVVVSKGLPPETIPSSIGGLTCGQITRILSVAHLKATCPATSSYSQSVPLGQAISWSFGGKTNPKTATYGSSVAITISKGKPPVAVPATGGDSSYTQAAGVLKNASLVPTEVEQSSTTVLAGEVIGTTPAGGILSPVGSTVSVIVSSGPPLVAIPNVIGEAVQTATAALEGAGLVVSNVYGPQTGTVVITSTPSAGTEVQRGTSVSLYAK